jgi:integrase
MCRRPSGRDRILVPHSRALGQALKWGEISRNVAELAEPIRPSRREMHPPSREQIVRFLESCEARRDRHAALWAVMAYTGCRPSEVLGLEWRDVDFDKAVIHVRRTRNTRTSHAPAVQATKTDSSVRVVNVDPELLRHLREHRQHQLEDRLQAGQAWKDEGIVFANRHGGALIWNNVRVDFQRALKAAGLPRSFRPYDLRHAHVTILLEQGEDLALVGKRVGHASPTLTGQVYAHLLPKHDRRLAASFGGALRGVGETAVS